MLDITEKCKEVWFNKEKYPRIRSNENIFTAEELSKIVILTCWLKQSSNIKERVMCIAHGFSTEPKCLITNKSIELHTPLYRIYTDKQLRNRCFFFKEKIKEKLVPPFYKQYSSLEVETLLHQVPLNTAIRCPLFINHCWVELEKKNFNLDEIMSNEEAFYLHVKKCKEIPLCPITRQKVPFNNKTFLYNRYSSKKAANIANGIKNKNKKFSPNVIELRKQTNLKKYGATTPIALKENYNKGLEIRRNNALVKKKKKDIIQEQDKRTPQQKRIDTICDKYNVKSLKEFREKYPISKESIKNGNIKRCTTLIKKYNTDNIRDVPEISNKIKNTNTEKYGVSCYMNLPHIKNAKKQKLKILTYNNFTRFAAICTPLFTIDEWLLNYDQLLPWKKTTTGETFYCKYYGYPPLGRFTSSSLEQTVQEMLTALKIDYNKHNRSVISPQEIDIYLPNYNLGIECNGEYFHSERVINKNYHLEKTKKCNEKNIHLLHFFGKDIKTKSNIVFNIIKTHTVGNKYKILGRKCSVRYITNKVARAFHNKYHLSGFCNARKHYGLFYKSRLVSVVSVGKHRFTKVANNCEIIRYSVMRNIYVVGGFAKILKQIKNDFKGQLLHTYADLNLFTGSVYTANGFTYVKDTVPDYYYSNGVNHISRYQAQKHKLKKLLKDSYNPNQTEEENMLSKGYYRVYGCGNKYFTLQL